MFTFLYRGGVLLVMYHLAWCSFILFQNAINLACIFVITFYKRFFAYGNVKATQTGLIDRSSVFSYSVLCHFAHKKSHENDRQFRQWLNGDFFWSFYVQMGWIRTQLTPHLDVKRPQKISFQSDRAYAECVPVCQRRCLSPCRPLRHILVGKTNAISPTIVFIN